MAKSLIVTQMVEVPPNEHVGRRRLRTARWRDSDVTKGLEKLRQGSARRIAVLAAPTRQTCQECTYARLVEIGDRDPLVSHPSNERHDHLHGAVFGDGPFGTSLLVLLSHFLTRGSGRDLRLG